MKLTTGHWRKIGSAVTQSLTMTLLTAGWIFSTHAIGFAQQTPAIRPEAPAPKAGEKPDDPGAAAKSDAAKAKAKEKPKKPSAPRQAQIDRPGAPRESLENFRGAIPLPLPKVSDRDLKEFEEMRRGRTPVRVAVINRVANKHVYELTHQENEARLPNSRQVILKTIQSARDPGSGNPIQDFRLAYKRALIRYAKDLLANTILIRTNALWLMLEMFDEEGPNVSDAVPIFMEVLRDPKQEIAVKYLALKGIILAKNFREIRVQQEIETAETLLAIVRNRNLQAVALQQIIETLGTLSQPYSGNVPERAEVAVYLANLAVDSDQKLRTRFTAAHALSRLNVGNINRWDYDLQAWIILKVMVEIVDANNNGKILPEFGRLWVYQLAESMQPIFARANPQMRALILEKAQPLINAVIYEEDTVDPLRELERGVEESKPTRYKLTPRAADVKLPKAIATEEKPAG